MKYLITVRDKGLDACEEYIIEARRNVTMKTVYLNALKQFVERYPDPTDFLREIKSFHREAYNSEDFLDDLEREMDLLLSLQDLNNHTYVMQEHNSRTGLTDVSYTTAYDVGYASYLHAFLDQRHEEDGNPDVDSYMPEPDMIIAHGNEILAEDEEWEREIETEYDDTFL